MPEGEEAAGLRRVIEDLARRFGTPRFEPHVTLLPGLPGDEGGILEKAAGFAPSLPPFEVRLGEPEGGGTYFRRLIARAEPTTALVDGHRLAARSFDRASDPEFLPHLSLLYGHLGAEVVAALCASEAGRVPGRFAVRHLDAWRTDGPVSAWRRLGRYSLSGERAAR
jgi:hypothetical protein